MTTRNCKTCGKKKGLGWWQSFRLVDESGFGALDHALMAQNLELEVWFCSHGARFQTQLEVLVEPVKNADYVALERRLRAGADVTVAWQKGWKEAKGGEQSNNSRIGLTLRHWK
jgi:hypothetical protein